jgi:hypothetical protein
VFLLQMFLISANSELFYLEYHLYLTGNNNPFANIGSLKIEENKINSYSTRVIIAFSFCTLLHRNGSSKECNGQYMLSCILVQSQAS